MAQKNGFDPFDLTPSDSEPGWGTWEERESVIYPSISSAPRLLLVQAGLEWQAFLEQALQEEGYVLQVASSLEQAVGRASARTFDFVLAHLSFDTPRQLFKAIKPLSEHIPPLKLGVITNWSASVEEAEEHDLAFVLSRPIAWEQLLTKIALCLHMPLTSQQEPQAQAVERFLDALMRNERQALLSECVDDIVAYSLPASPEPLARPIRGKEALGAYVETLRRAYRALRLEVRHIYSQPKGLVVEYLQTAASAEDWELTNHAFLVQFTGNLIRQIGWPPAKIN